MQNISIGQKFGRWTVIGGPKQLVYGRSKINASICRCSCGTIRNVSQVALKQGKSTSCGCRTIERSSEVNTKHGASKDYTPEYEAWRAMRARCLNQNNPRFSKYGGRGIIICDRWNDYDSFLKDMGPRPTPKHSLDRIDNDGNYEPSNCRWATSHQQMTNRSITQFVQYKGEKIPLATLAKRHGIPANTLRYRILKGWAIDDAIGRPVRPKRHSQVK